MKTFFKKSETQSKALILYFAGWGTSYDLILPLGLPEHTDLLACFDYDGDFALPIDLAAYDHLQVYAWSMGVWAAERTLSIVTDLPKMHKTAINGTALPIHAQYGIDPIVFEQTHAGILSAQAEQVRHKFERRMCVDKSTLAYYQSFPKRSTDNIAKELDYLYDAATQDQRIDLITWDLAVVSRQDKIFLPEHQVAYWQTRCPVIERDSGHFQAIQTWQSWQVS